MSYGMVADARWHRRGDVIKARRAANLTEQQLFTRAKQEADGAAGWASWKAGTANLNIDVAGMLAADFELTA